MSSDAVHQILELIEAHVQSRPSPIEFEMAYQARVAIERIKFAIKHTEQFAPRTDPIREVGLQLLDALERLESVDRQFQQRTRFRQGSAPSEANGIVGRTHGKGAFTGSANGQPAKGAGL
jgi:hypothetical protein